jgi:hypothetical protein
MKRLILAAVATAVTLSATVLSAHDDYRIIGVLTKVEGNEIWVKQAKDGKVIGADIDSQTVVTKDKKKLDRTALKAGLNVVVDATGDSLDDLLVLEIRLVPPPKGK